MSTQATPASSRELVLTRVVDLPRERLFQAWATRLVEWWAPKPLATPVCEVDFRAGGRLRTVMRAPDGAEYPCGGVFLEIVANERIVFTDAFGPGWEPNPGAFFTAIVTLEELPAQRTKYTARALHWTEENCRKHEQMGFHEGWGQCLEQLVAVAGQI